MTDMFEGFDHDPPPVVLTKKEVLRPRECARCKHIEANQERNGFVCGLTRTKVSEHEYVYCKLWDSSETTSKGVSHDQLD